MSIQGRAPAGSPTVPLAQSEPLVEAPPWSRGPDGRGRSELPHGVLIPVGHGLRTALTGDTADHDRPGRAAVRRGVPARPAPAPEHLFTPLSADGTALVGPARGDPGVLVDAGNLLG
ncbi:hypothetical protein [Streptomyces sp. NBC_01235]|uniref:hypothetical protein n=1 Tax=Streptomyces sp. NBC_01235 TaxID=2903788 RepID=UPI002E132982|nr:hypothetical protein OG289_18805 [Streptomyces sp. NBC_01235]